MRKFDQNKIYSKYNTIPENMPEKQQKECYICCYRFYGMMAAAKNKEMRYGGETPLARYGGIFKGLRECKKECLLEGRLK